MSCFWIRIGGQSTGDDAVNPFVDENVSDDRRSIRFQMPARRLISRLQFLKFHLTRLRGE